MITNIHQKNKMIGLGLGTKMSKSLHAYDRSENALLKTQFGVIISAFLKYIAIASFIHTTFLKNNFNICRKYFVSQDCVQIRNDAAAAATYILFHLKTIYS